MCLRNLTIIKIKSLKTTVSIMACLRQRGFIRYYVSKHDGMAYIVVETSWQNFRIYRSLKEIQWL